MLAISYCRVSTDEQAVEGVSLEAQRARVQSFAAARALTLVAHFEDAGHTASTLKRPGLQAALGALRDGRAVAFVVAKSDRLTRRVLHAEQLLEQHFGADAPHTLLSASESFDAKTADGVMFLQMLMMFAERELRTIRERTRGALQHKRANGRVSGATPLGFDRDGDTLVENAAEAGTLTRIAQLHAGGVSLGAIARQLVLEGHKTKRGGKWTAWTVSKLLPRARAALPISPVIPVSIKR